MAETTPDPGQLAHELRAVYRLLKQRVREHGGLKDLSSAQVAVLVRLEQDGAATVSGLARSEGMRPQSMREVVAPLQEAGFLKATQDTNDGRQTLLSLTPKCVKWIAQKRSASHDWLTARVAGMLSAREQQQLSNALRLLRRLVDE